MDERAEIRAFRLPLDQGVEVIGHEGVRNYYEPFNACSAAKLLQRDVHNVRNNENRVVAVGADR